MFSPSWFSRAFNEKCDKLGVEPTMSRDCSSIRFVCPKIPDKNIQDEILKGIPEDFRSLIRAEWKEDLKSSTQGAIEIICSQLKMVKIVKDLTLDRPSNHKVTVKVVTSGLPGTAELFSKDGITTVTLAEILQSDAYVDYFEIIVNDERVRSFNRPLARAIESNLSVNHDKITADDATDLKIMLETCGSVDDFINQM